MTLHVYTISFSKPWSLPEGCFVAWKIDLFDIRSLVYTLATEDYMELSDTALLETCILA